MDAWVGPAIVAAVISGLVSLLVVQLSFRQERKGDQIRREEKIRDFQIALRAEVKAELENLRRHDLVAFLAEAEARYAAEPGFSVSVPRFARQIVFDAIVAEIHILPEDVIGPVVLYVRQRQVVESLAEDMRDPRFKELAGDRQLAMYRDYLELRKVWKELAEQAERALARGARQ